MRPCILVSFILVGILACSRADAKVNRSYIPLICENQVVQLAPHCDVRLNLSAKNGHLVRLRKPAGTEGILMVHLQNNSIQPTWIFLIQDPEFAFCTKGRDTSKSKLLQSDSVGFGDRGTIGGGMPDGNYTLKVDGNDRCGKTDHYELRIMLPSDPRTGAVTPTPTETPANPTPTRTPAAKPPAEKQDIADLAFKIIFAAGIVAIALLIVLIRNIRRERKESGGFSLTELLVIVAIIGFIACFAIPTLLLNNLPQDVDRNTTSVPTAHP